MPLRSRHTVALALFACALGACALQTGGLGPRDDGDTDAGATSSANDASAESSSAATDASANDSATSSGDATAPDTSITSPDASSGADAGDGGDPCDKDNDGHREMGNVCFGDDCCDVDRLVHPGQTDFFATRNACGTFDYDCNGRETVENGNANCQLGFFTCSGDGFATTTACGVTATYTSCAWAGFSCNHNDDMRAQRCH